MKFKTTIEIISEAQDRSEALDIVGDYLSGYLFSGVDMRCTTNPFHPYKKILISIASVSLIAILVTFYAHNTRPSHNFNANPAGFNAVQLPLKTSGQDVKDSDFRKEWQLHETREALKHIKK